MSLNLKYKFVLEDLASCIFYASDCMRVSIANNVLSVVVSNYKCDVNTRNNSKGLLFFV